MAERWIPAAPDDDAPFRSRKIEAPRTAPGTGDATPLGLLGFASGTFTLNVVLASWFPMSTALFATPVVFIFGGLGQFIAGMWSYRHGDPFWATAFGAFGAFNTSYALYLWLRSAGVVHGPGSGLGVIGVFVAGFSLIAVLLMVAALWKSLAVAGIFFWLAVAYGLVGAGDIAAGASNLIGEGGWAGIFSATIAFYVAGAMIVNSTAQADVLPLGAPLVARRPRRLSYGPPSTVSPPRI